MIVAFLLALGASTSVVRPVLYTEGDRRNLLITLVVLVSPVRKQDCGSALYRSGDILVLFVLKIKTIQTVHCNLY